MAYNKDNLLIFIISHSSLFVNISQQKIQTKRSLSNGKKQETHEQNCSGWGSIV